MTYKSTKELKQFADDDEVPWTMGHAFFANMGGFVLEVEKRMVSEGKTENALLYLNAKAIFLARSSPCKENGNE